MEHALQSPTVQKALPDLAGLHNTLGFDGFLASPPPTVTSEPRAVREHIRGYAVQLERHERFTELWKHQVCWRGCMSAAAEPNKGQYNNQLVTLRQLITAFDSRCQELQQQSARLSFAAEHDLDKQLLGLPEFEDLYYFLACKTRSLYSDLQLRFSSNFITMDNILHYRGSSSYAQSPCTVRDIRNFLRAVWFHLLHPIILRSIEEALHHRKYQALKANPLLPAWNRENTTVHEQERMSQFQLGLNLDPTMMVSMFEHLEDVSTMSIPALLMKVSRRGLGNQFAPSDSNVSSVSLDKQPQNAIDKAWLALARDDEQHTQTQVMETEMEDAPAYERELFRGFRSQEDDIRAVAEASRWQPHQAEPQFMVGRAHEDQPTRGITRLAPVLHSVRTGQPNVVASEVRSPFSTISGDVGVTKHYFPHSTPKTHSSGHSIPSNPSNYRMPFHGFNEFRHEPPTPPPKSPRQLVQMQQLEFEIGQQMQRDSSRLQEALAQVEVLQRENSHLQERLSTPSPSKNLFRRLSKTGTRTPRKSPRKSIIRGVMK